MVYIYIADCFRTTDNCFILRALVERARAKGIKLYICAVDLEKAFDSVDRQLLWAGLRRAGIGGRMLATLQALHADVPVCVRTDEGLSSTFQSNAGYKVTRLQGESVVGASEAHVRCAAA